MMRNQYLRAHRGLLLCTLCLVWGSACKKKLTGAETTNEDTPSPVVTAPATPAPQPADPAEPQLSAAEIRGVVETWREAQTDGSFADYAALYDASFTGIKRAGKRTQTFDRDGWLADRERMFTRSMQVAVADLTVDLRGDRAVVEFTQTWISGRFGDRGRKRLIIEKRADALRITGEEMLDSTLILTEEACLRTVFSRYRPKKRQVEEPEWGWAEVASVQILEDPAGHWFACVTKLLYPDDKGGEYHDEGMLYLSAIVRAGKRWRAIMTTSGETFDYAPYPSEDEETSEVEIVTKDARVELRSVAISPKENALVYTIIKETSAWEDSSTKTQTTFYQIRRGGAQELWSLDTESEGGTTHEHTRKEELEFLTTTTHGYYDARFTTTEITTNDLTGARDEEKSVVILTWSDDGYRPTDG